MKKKESPKRVEWIFFDIGDVLVNEDRIRYKIYCFLEETLLKNGVSLSFEDLIKAREELILDHSDEAPHYTIAKRYLSSSRYHLWHKGLRDLVHKRIRQDAIMVPHIKTAIRQLSTKYKLGLIADQPHEILDFLRSHRILKHFKVHAISSVVGLNKPKRRIFEWAVNHASVSFDQCMMIGDRIDRDILPANQLDMTTIQVLWPIDRKGYRPTGRKARLYLASLKRVRNWHLIASGADQRPDAIVEDIRYLTRTIDRLAA